MVLFGLKYFNSTFYLAYMQSIMGLALNFI